LVEVVIKPDGGGVTMGGGVTGLLRSSAGVKSPPSC